MFTRPGLERVLVAAAIFLSLFPSWRYRPVFFTVSDLLFCFSLLALLLTRGLPRAPFGALTPYWYTGFALLLVSLLGSSLINGDPTRALIVGAQYLFSYVLLPLAIMGRDKEETVNLVQVFAAGVFVANLASIILYYSGYTGDFRFVTGSGRLASFAEGPNGHAQMIALACPLVLYLWLAGRMAAYFLVPLLCILIVSLVLTSSNNGIALVIVGAAAFFIMLRDLRYLARAAAGLVACLVLILVWGSYWLPVTFEERVLGGVRSGSIENAGSFEDRMALMAEALEMVDESMLVGVGVDQYRVLSQYGVPVHNSYLLLWVEGGLLALIGWVCLLMIVLLGSVLIAKSQRLVAATGFALAVIFSSIGFTTAHIYSRQSVIPLYLAMALVIAYAPEIRARRASRHRRSEDADRPSAQETADAGSPPGPMARPAPPGARW
jgi:O-antigen ligase